MHFNVIKLMKINKARSPQITHYFEESGGMRFLPIKLSCEQSVQMSAALPKILG